MALGGKSGHVSPEEMDQMHSALIDKHNEVTKMFENVGAHRTDLLQHELDELKELKKDFENLDKSKHSRNTIMKYSATGNDIEELIRKAEQLLSGFYSPDTTNQSKSTTDEEISTFGIGLTEDNDVTKKIKEAQEWMHQGIIQTRTIHDTGQFDSEEVTAMLQAKVAADKNLNNSQITTLVGPMYDISRFVEHIDKAEKKKFLQANGEQQDRQLSEDERRKLNQQCQDYINDINPMYMMLKAMETNQTLLNQCGANGKGLLDCQEIIIPVRHAMSDGNGHHFTAVNLSIKPDPKNEDKKLISVTYTDSFGSIKAGDPFVQQIFSGVEKFVSEHPNCVYTEGTKMHTGKQKDSDNCGLFTVANGLAVAREHIIPGRKIENPLDNLPEKYNGAYHQAMMQQRAQAIETINQAHQGPAKYVKFSETRLDVRHKELTKLNAKLDKELGKETPDPKSLKALQKDYQKLLARVEHHKEKAPDKYFAKIEAYNRSAELDSAVQKIGAEKKQDSPAAKAGKNHTIKETLPNKPLVYSKGPSTSNKENPMRLEKMKRTPVMYSFEQMKQNMADQAKQQPEPASEKKPKSPRKN